MPRHGGDRADAHVGLKPIQMDHVDEPDLELREALPKDGYRGQGLLLKDVPRGCYEDVRLGACVGAWPLPDADALAVYWAWVQFDGLHQLETLQEALWRHALFRTRGTSPTIGRGWPQRA